MSPNIAPPVVAPDSTGLSLELALAIGRHLIARILSAASGAKYTCKGMRRRGPPNTADTRWYLSKFLRGVDRANMPGYSAALLLHISGEPEGRASYAEAMKECGLNEGQMERAVRALLDERLIVRSDDDEDARVKWLTVTTDGQHVVDDLIKQP